MIPTAPFGSTGHDSTRIILGAAALFGGPGPKADAALETLREAGVNHIDAAASYGDAELALAPWMKRHRDEFFLATKTGKRDYAGAREQIEASRQRMQVDQIDLIQLHCLVDPEEQETALGPDGALRACVEARDAGHVRFIGVTGHGTMTPRMHLASLERFDFASVLLPLNPALMADAGYAGDFDRLLDRCRERGVAVQTIKAIARRRWPKDINPNRTCWYQPLESPEAIERAVHFALSHEGVFVNTASDLSLLPHALRAGETFASAPAAPELEEDRRHFDIVPLFAPGAEVVGR